MYICVAERGGECRRTEKIPPGNAKVKKEEDSKGKREYIRNRIVKFPTRRCLNPE